ncbi:MAG: hypothetical protein NTX69_06380 [Candidatus Bipolaricaulota bacterium]|nr:hypothetical protein [Candidatus Bipolaricaulota bacterium]
MKWILFGCVVGGIVGLALGIPLETQTHLVPLADVGGLASAALRSPAEPDARLFVLSLPRGAGAVVLRAMPRSEWGSFQVRAVSWDVIECEMLAATVVQPAITPADAAGIAPDLSALLKRAINEASGFEVFPDVPLPTP